MNFIFRMLELMLLSFLYGYAKIAPAFKPGGSVIKNMTLVAT